MMPLASIVKGYGYDVAGSDRSYDQGRTPEKFTHLQSIGIRLYPQDGSGVTPDCKAVVISTAVEDHIPDIARAKELGVPIVHRAELLAEFFNQSKTRIAIAGTSGKTTTTGMIGFMLNEMGLSPTVMNGGVLRNYADANPYCAAFVGNGDIFVTEADESDGSIARYNPTIAVLNNIALDHKPLEELIPLFRDYLMKADKVVLNYDSAAVRDLAKDLPAEKIISYGLHSDANTPLTLTLSPAGRGEHGVAVRERGKDVALNLQVPGQYNLSNALAALGVIRALDLDIVAACAVLSRFAGIKRRMETIGTRNGITVIDDFAHNPDKITASLSALKEKPGRLIVFFQPHGYGFLKLLKDELADCFSHGLSADDHLFLVEPFYAGGTVDRSIGAKDIAARITGPHVSVQDDRAAVKQAILDVARPGDRIIIMGARDDTLSEFAKDILNQLSS